MERHGSPHGDENTNGHTFSPECTTNNDVLTVNYEGGAVNGWQLGIVPDVDAWSVGDEMVFTTVVHLNGSKASVDDLVFAFPFDDGREGNRSQSRLGVEKNVNPTVTPVRGGTRTSLAGMITSLERIAQSRNAIILNNSQKVLDVVVEAGKVDSQPENKIVGGGLHIKGPSGVNKSTIDDSCAINSGYCTIPPG